MEAPVVNRQKKNTLRVSKPKKETVKNVLATPFANYWPLVKNEDEVTITDILKKHLPKMREYKTTIPWKDVKHVPREQRKDFRKTYHNIEFEPPDKQTKLSLIFGINEVTKLLETNEASSVLLANDIIPRLMVRHVVDLAVLRRTPILVVPQLRELLRTSTGINGVAVAFRNKLTIDSNLYLIDKTIKDIYVSYPVPENHINYNRSEDFFNVKSSENICKASENSTEMELHKEAMDLHEDVQDVPIADLYLYRQSTSHRVFVPESKKNSKDVGTLDFISFSNHDEGDAFEDDKISNTECYNSLIVKRIRSNKDRNKKKIAMLKGKKKIKKLK